MTTPKFEAYADKAKLAALKVYFEFVGGNIKNAMRVAINKTLPKIRTLSSTEIRKQVRLQAGYVNDKLTVRKATRAKVSGAISTPSRGLLLTKFSTDTQVASDGIRWLKPPKAPPRGIRVKVKPVSGSAKVVGPNAAGNNPFYIVLKTSRVLGIARRIGRGRNDLEVLHGPSISQVFDDVRVDVTPEASVELTRQTMDAMRYILLQMYPPEPTDAD